MSDNRTVWVYPVNEQVSDENIKIEFSDVGNVVRIDRSSSGYCFVTYSNQQEAEKAIKTKNRDFFHGRFLKVEAAISEERDESSVQLKVDGARTNWQAFCLKKFVCENFNIYECKSVDPGAFCINGYHVCYYCLAMGNGYQSHRNVDPDCPCRRPGWKEFPRFKSARERELAERGQGPTRNQDQVINRPSANLGHEGRISASRADLISTPSVPRSSPRRESRSPRGPVDLASNPPVPTRSEPRSPQGPEDLVSTPAVPRSSPTPRREARSPRGSTAASWSGTSRLKQDNRQSSLQRVLSATSSSGSRYVHSVSHNERSSDKEQLSRPSDPLHALPSHFQHQRVSGTGGDSLINLRQSGVKRSRSDANPKEIKSRPRPHLTSLQTLDESLERRASNITRSDSCVSTTSGISGIKELTQIEGSMDVARSQQSPFPNGRGALDPKEATASRAAPAFRGIGAVIDTGSGQQQQQSSLNRLSLSQVKSRTKEWITKTDFSGKSRIPTKTIEKTDWYTRDNLRRSTSVLGLKKFGLRESVTSVPVYRQTKNPAKISAASTFTQPPASFLQPGQHMPPPYTEPGGGFGYQGVFPEGGPQSDLNSGKNTDFEFGNYSEEFCSGVAPGQLGSGYGGMRQYNDLDSFGFGAAGDARGDAGYFADFNFNNSGENNANFEFGLNWQSDFD